MRYRGVEVDGICKHDHINMYTLTLEKQYQFYTNNCSVITVEIYLYEYQSCWQAEQ